MNTIYSIDIVKYPAQHINVLWLNWIFESNMKIFDIRKVNMSNNSKNKSFQQASYDSANAVEQKLKL